MQNIITEIIEYTHNNSPFGMLPAEWYIGITSNPEQRLFAEHNVQKNGIWIYVNCHSETMARVAEKYLIETYNFRGGTGGGDNPTFVYAYKITSFTRE